MAEYAEYFAEDGIAETTIGFDKSVYEWVHTLVDVIASTRRARGNPIKGGYLN